MSGVLAVCWHHHSVLSSSNGRRPVPHAERCRSHGLARALETASGPSKLVLKSRAAKEKKSDGLEMRRMRSWNTLVHVDSSQVAEGSRSPHHERKGDCPHRMFLGSLSALVLVLVVLFFSACACVQHCGLHGPPLEPARCTAWVSHSIPPCSHSGFSARITVLFCPCLCALVTPEAFLQPLVTPRVWD